MICHVCNEENGPLIKGKCKVCDPVAHKKYLETKSEEIPESEEPE